MVEVSSDNFNDVLHKLSELIPSSSFVAIDCEFTGLGNRSESASHFDSIDQRYQKMKQVVQRYIIIQFGLSVFTLTSPQPTKMECHTFNFNIFPAGTFKDIVLSVSTATFLLRHQVSFDYWIQKGLNSMTFTEEKLYRKKLDKLEELEPIDSIPPKDAEFFEKIKEDITQWVDEVIKRQFNEDEEDMDYFTTPELNPFRRRLVYQFLRETHPYIWAEPEKAALNASLKLSYMGGTDEGTINAFKAKMREEKVERAVGFRRVLDLIQQNKIPVVGHNMLFDLMYIYEHLLDSLPATYLEFKTNILAQFPIIIDTKFLLEYQSTNYKYISTKLEDIYSDMKRTAERQHIDLITSKNMIDKMKAHNAGYDSFMTGYVFCNYLNHEKHEFSHFIAKMGGTHCNKLYLTSGQMFLDLDNNNNDELFFKPDNAFVIFGDGVGEGYSVQNHIRQEYGPCTAKRIDRDAIIVLFVEEKDETTSTINRKDIKKPIHKSKDIKQWNGYKVVKWEHHVREKDRGIYWSLFIAVGFVIGLVFMKEINIVKT